MVPVEEIEALAAKFDGTATWMLTVAEEAFFVNDERKADHFGGCYRQWRSAADDVRALAAAYAQLETGHA